MNTITYYAYDSQMIYTNSIEFNIYGPIPQNSTPLVPPNLSGTEVAQLQGAGWVILDERPVVVQIEEPIMIVPELVAEPVVLAKIDYLKLFTQDERISIYRASLTNNKIRDYLYMLDSSTTVSLDDIDIQNGLATMESMGLLSQARVTQIKTSEPA